MGCVGSKIPTFSTYMGDKEKNGQTFSKRERPRGNRGMYRGCIGRGIKLIPQVVGEAEGRVV